MIIKKTIFTKWQIAWGLFFTIFALFIILVLPLAPKSEFHNVLLQVGGLFFTLCAAIVIMLQNNEQIKKSTKAQLDYQQELFEKQNYSQTMLAFKQNAELSNNTNRQVNQFKSSIEEQIKVIVESTDKQIKAYTENTDKQIQEYRTLANEQIKTYQDSTNKQIQNYYEQTNAIVNKLSENSFLLAELVKRELEEAILDTRKKISAAKAKYNELSKFQAFRSPDTKVTQLKNQKTFIEGLEEWLSYFTEKYNKIIEIPGINA